MIKLGLIGNPISHSLSPGIHQGFMKNEGLEGSYELFELGHLPEEGLNRFMNSRELIGMNVTIPFKQTVIEHLDEVDELALELNAVNTVVKKNNRLIGFNTDVYGIEQSLNSLSPKGLSALIFGAGGAARAVFNVLTKRGFKARLVSRNLRNSAYQDLNREEYAQYKLWVNCTPVGSEGVQYNLLPLPYDVLNEEFAIFDLVYKPNPTPLMHEGLKCGAKVLGGEKMLNEQATKSWELFRDAYYNKL
jgi:shikimate dehydrogenase